RHQFRQGSRRSRGVGGAEFYHRGHREGDRGGSDQKV
ncbi:uncharacterized protein METZ01_LOCUS320120, partial [marine metagenome]